MDHASLGVLPLPTGIASGGNNDGPVWRALGEARRQLAEHWLGVSEPLLAARYPDALGNAHCYLQGSGLRDLPPSAGDVELIQRVQTTLAGAGGSGAILAGMLLAWPHQLPFRWNLPGVAPWLINDYMRFMVTIPQLSLERGDAERFCEFMQKWVGYLHQQTVAANVPDFWRQVALFFAQAANFIPLYFNEGNLRDVCRQRSQIMEHALVRAGSRLDHVFPARSPRKRIRLGILAAHFLPQTETYATLPVYRHLDRGQFEVILLSLQNRDHPLQRFCQSHADQFVALPQDLAQQVQLIRQLDLDVVFIGTNVTAVTNGVALLALHRLARVQIASVCSCITTGMRNVDCYVSGRLSEGPSAQDHYTEQLWMVDGPAHCYDFGPDSAVQPGGKLDRRMLDIPDSAIVFASGANFHKILPELDDAWMRILARVPDSRLVLYPFNPNWSSSYPVDAFLRRLASAAERAGVEPSRIIVFKPAQGRGDILQRLKLGDIYLDSFPFSGATSLLDPLQAGLPPVVRDGKCFRTLVGPALMRDIELGELVAPDEAAYVELAVRLATDVEYRSRVSATVVREMQAVPSFLDPTWYRAQITRVLGDICRQRGLV